MHAPPLDLLGVNAKRNQKGSVRGQYVPSSLQDLLLAFSPCFTQPSFENFVLLVSGWIVCQGRHCISRVIQLGGGPAQGKHFSALYRFLSRASWNPDVLGRVVFDQLVPWLAEAIEVQIDDTLCHRSGPHIFGAGMHHDSARSSYGKGRPSGSFASFAFGQNWVVLSLRVPLPWERLRGIAVPILFRLYRPKRRCPAGQYRKRTELARELMQLIRSWIPEPSRLFVTGDAEYACQTLLRSLEPSVTFIGPMVMNAALYEPAGVQSGRGRPRKKGRRLESPCQLAARTSMPWRRTTLAIYGRKIEVLVKSVTCLWYTVSGTRLLRVVVTKDPTGRIEERAYFSTDSSLSAEELLERFSRRWMIEVSFRDAKQNLGLEEPQNGWSRRRKGRRKGRKRPGPQARGRRGERATQHTFPLIFLAYAVVVIWYLENGRPQEDLKRARKRMSWYRTKTAPSFNDMLVALRRQIWAGRLSDDPHDARARQKLLKRLNDAGLAA